MIVEKVERRILGAMRLVNAVSSLPVSHPISIVGEGLRLVRNLHGEYVILDAPKLSEHTRTFEAPPGTPAVQSVKIPLNITDPLGEFLPQRFVLELPRHPDPMNANSIFKPVLIPLYLAPTARSEINWVLMHATVREQTSRKRLPWSLIQILKKSNDELLATGMSDSRGEALIVVAGILFAMPAEDSSTTVTREIEVHLKSYFDKDQLEPISDAELVQDRPNPNADYLPNVSLLDQLPSRSVQIQGPGTSGPSDTIKIAAGQMLVADLLVDLS